MKENLKIIDAALSFLTRGFTESGARIYVIKYDFTSTSKSYVKASHELMQASVVQEGALCTNRAGEWSLMKNGYMATSHVREEGIQVSSQNLGLSRYILHQIFKILEPVGVTWIWLDGLVTVGANRTLSSSEEALKTDIINNLALVYE